MNLTSFFSILVLIVSVMALVLAVMQYAAFRARQRMAKQSGASGGSPAPTELRFFRRYNPR